MAFFLRPELGISELRQESINFANHAWAKTIQGDPNFMRDFSLDKKNGCDIKTNIRSHIRFN